MPPLTPRMKEVLQDELNDLFAHCIIEVRSDHHDLDSVLLFSFLHSLLYLLWTHLFESPSFHLFSGIRFLFTAMRLIDSLVPSGVVFD